MAAATDVTVAGARVEGEAGTAVGDEAQGEGRRLPCSGCHRPRTGRRAGRPARRRGPRPSRCRWPPSVARWSRPPDPTMSIHRAPRSTSAVVTTTPPSATAIPKTVTSPWSSRRAAPPWPAGGVGRARARRCPRRGASSAGLLGVGRRRGHRVVGGRGEQEDHPGHHGHDGDGADGHHDGAAPGVPRRGFEEHVLARRDPPPVRSGGARRGHRGRSSRAGARRGRRDPPLGVSGTVRPVDPPARRSLMGEATESRGGNAVGRGASRTMRPHVPRPGHRPRHGQHARLRQGKGHRPQRADGDRPRHPEPRGARHRDRRLADDRADARLHRGRAPAARRARSPTSRSPSACSGACCAGSG